MDDDNISLYVPTPTPEPAEDDVNRLREDATRTAQDIIEYIQSSFITKENFAEFREMLEKKLTDIDDANMCTYKTLTELIVNANGGYGKFLYDTIIEEYNRSREKKQNKRKKKKEKVVKLQKVIINKVMKLEIMFQLVQEEMQIMM